MHPDQYNFGRANISTRVPGDEGEGFLNTSIAIPGASFCPQSCLDSLSAAVSHPIRPGIQGWVQRSRLGFICPIHYTTAQRHRSSKPDWVSQQLQVRWWLPWLAYFFCWAHKIISPQPANLQAMCTLQGIHPFIYIDRWRDHTVLQHLIIQYFSYTDS